MQKAALKSLVRKKKHAILTPLIISKIDNLSNKELAEKNLNKSLGKPEENMIIE